MQRFYRKILLHGLGAVSFSQSRQKSTPSDLNELRSGWHDAEACRVTDWLPTVRRRGSRISDGPGLSSQNPDRLRDREVRTTLRIDWCLAEVRPIPIPVGFCATKANVGSQLSFNTASCTQPVEIGALFRWNGRRERSRIRLGRAFRARVKPVMDL